MNVVYFHTHDMGRWIAPYGFPAHTPNYSRLADEGLVFRQAFCAAPTCSPSRSALLTGQWAHSSGMLGLAHRGGVSLKDKTQHLATFLSGHGYETVLGGVQHEAAHAEWQELGYDRRLEPRKLDLPKAETWEEKGLQHTLHDAALADAAVDFIREPHEKPFFLSVGLVSPHRAFPAPGPLDNPDRMQPPATLPDAPDTRYDMASFVTMMRSVDECLGKVLDAIDEAGLAEETLFIATTDHGPAFPGMKCTLRDFGIAVALLLRGPGLEERRGTITDALVSQIDLYPTLCDLLGLAKPAWLQGESLVPVIRKERDEVRDEVYAEVTYHAAFEPKRCVRTHRYKYIKRFDDFELTVKPNIDDGPSKQFLLREAALAERAAEPIEALYDLYYDPSEKDNLIKVDAYSDIAYELRERLATWMQETDDPLLENPRPPIPGAHVNRQSSIDIAEGQLEKT